MIRKGLQKGFTLVELITVIAVVSLMAIYLSVEMGDVEEDTKVALASAFLLDNVPAAIRSFRSRHAGNCDFDNSAEGAATIQLVGRGLTPTTPWGDIWQASYNLSARQITIEFPTTHADNTDLAAFDIGNAADKSEQTMAAQGGVLTAVTTPAENVRALRTSDGTALTFDATIAATAFNDPTYIECAPGAAVACVTYECN